MLKFDLVCFCACVKRCVRWGHMFQEFMVLDPSFCSRKRVDFLFVEQWLIIMLRCLKKGPDIVCRFRRGQRAGWGNYGDSNIKGAMMLCPYVLVNQLCPTLCDPSCPWDFPGKNTGVGSHSCLKGIFPTKGSNRGLLHCKQILYCLSHQKALIDLTSP